MNIDGVGPFTDNGRAGDQDLVLFLQGNGASASQTLTGLASGRKYIVGFLVNGRLCCGPEENSYAVSFDDAELRSETFSPVGGANPYLVRQTAFTAAASEGTLKFTHTTSAGDHTLLLDNIVVLPEAGSNPFVLLHPNPAMVEAGASATFFAGAVGSGTLTYQWKKNGAAITGQVTDTLVLDIVTVDMAGDYSVDVKNAAGTVTSRPAMLTVLEPIAGLFDTGVDDKRVALSDAAVDAHYTLVQNADAASSTKAFVQDGSKWPIVAGPWLANSEVSKWIGPRIDPGAESPLSGPAGGDYIYRLKLDLTGYSPSSVVLSGGWASDNSASLFINGVNTGLAQAGFGNLSAFRVVGVFKPGLNDIDFKVANGDAAGGPTGLRVEGIRAVGAKSGGQTSTPNPKLAVSRTGANLVVSWPAPSTGFVLESATSVTGPWAVVNLAPANASGALSVTLTSSDAARFYRLRK